MTTVDVSRRLGITQSAVTKAVYRGEKLANGKGFQMMPDAKRTGSCRYPNNMDRSRYHPTEIDFSRA
jgi:hypothetical protein